LDRGSELFPLVKRVQETAETKGFVTLRELKALVESPAEKKLLNGALRFLLDRSELLLDVEGEAFFSRKWLTQRIGQALAQEGPLSMASLAQISGCGIATCCEVLGWLARGGQVRLLPGELVEALSPRRKSGSFNPDAKNERER